LGEGEEKSFGKREKKKEKKGIRRVAPVNHSAAFYTSSCGPVCFVETKERKRHFKVKEERRKQAGQNGH